MDKFNKANNLEQHRQTIHDDRHYECGKCVKNSTKLPISEITKGLLMEGWKINVEKSIEPKILKNKQASHEGFCLLC